MTVENNRKKWMIVIIGVVVLITMTCIGIFAVGPLIERKQMENRCEAIYLYMTKYDEKFSQQYGKPVLVELDTERDWKKVNENEFHIPCLVTVESGARYLVWVDYIADYSDTSMEWISIELFSS